MDLGSKSRKNIGYVVTLGMAAVIEVTQAPLQNRVNSLAVLHDWS